MYSQTAVRLYITYCINKKGHLSRQPIPNKLTQKNYLNYIFRLSDYKNSDF